MADGLAEAERLLDAAAQAEEDALAAEMALALARDEENFLRAPAGRGRAQGAKTRRPRPARCKNCCKPAPAPWPAVLEQIVVAKGYEAALGAALGEDLDASDDDNAPVHWSSHAKAAAIPPCPPAPGP